MEGRLDEKARLERDIATLKESIELNRMHLAQRTGQELREILQHTAWCLSELEILRREADSLLGRSA